MMNRWLGTVYLRNFLDSKLSSHQTHKTKLLFCLLSQAFPLQSLTLLPLSDILTPAANVTTISIALFATNESAKAFILLGVLES